MTRSASPAEDLRTHPKVERLQFGPVVVEFDAQVLRPRSWTILQSQWAAELAAVSPRGPILELCAGAGHIGLAAAVLSGRDLVQVEQDPHAARFAARNAVTAGHGDHIEVRVGRMQDVLRGGERFPVVVADPPYLPTAEVVAWPDDPITAIDGGADGLDLLRVCLQVSAAHLLPGGHVLLQVAGQAQADRIADELPTGLMLRNVRAVDDRRAVVHLAAIG